MSKTVQASLKKIHGKLNKENQNISGSMHNSLVSVLEDEKMNKFLQLFWTEQKKAFAKDDPKGMRWHPMMIRLAIFLRSQSPSAYNSIRDTGILKLPGERILRDYTNYIQPQTGLNAAVLEDICHQTEGLSENERWCVLLHDKMSIKSDLIYDRRSGELVGYVDSHKWNFDSKKDSSDDNIATHVLVFMVVGVCSQLKVTLGYWATKCATAAEMYPIFWKAIGYLETTCKLKVKF